MEKKSKVHECNYFVCYQYKDKDGSDGIGNMMTKTSHPIMHIEDIANIELFVKKKRKYKNVVVTNFQRIMGNLKHD